MDAIGVATDMEVGTPVVVTLGHHEGNTGTVCRKDARFIWITFDKYSDVPAYRSMEFGPFVANELEEI